MLNRNIKLIKFKLNNYAPFYQSMGLKSFSFDRSTSKNKLVLILGGNGSGKSYLLSELSPEPLESQLGRNSNRFIEGKEGYKELTYLVDDSIEYTCKITYSADRRKTTCFLTKSVNGVEEELNPNGNVGSYIDLCKAHLGYYKTYKNIGHISNGVKNVVTMSQAERQSLVSTWLPNMEEFLSASKTAQKKYNQADREIKGLVADIAKISFDEYSSKRETLKSQLQDIEDKIKLIRDNISKLEVHQGNLKNFSRLNLNQKKTEFLNKLSNYEKEVTYNKNIFDKYFKYLNGSESSNKELQNLLAEKEKELIFCSSEENNINSAITETSISIDKIKGELNFDKASNADLSTINASMELLEKDISSTEKDIKKTLEDYPEYEKSIFSPEAKDFTKIVLNTFENFCSVVAKMNTNCDGFSLRDIMQNTVIDKLEKRIDLLLESTASIEKTNESIEENILEKERSKIDESILSFAPKGCTEKTCGLIKKILEKSKIESDVSNLRSDVLENKLKISENNTEIEKAKMTMNNVKNTLMDANSINDSLMKINDKFIHFPDSLMAKLNREPEFIVENLNDIISDIKNFDEYLSILEKNTTAKSSLDNLKNISKVLSMKDAKNRELNELYEKNNELRKQRELKTKQREGLYEEKEELNTLINSIEKFKEKKIELEIIRKDLETTKQNLLKENKCVYYKNIIDTCLSSLKIKLIDFENKDTNLKTEIEKCNSLISSRNTLVDRQNNLEKRKKIYGLAYKIWNSKTGYPSLVIKDFLSEVTYETNKNLDEIWGGLIRTEDFVIDESEFRVPVIKGNTELRDVSECSTAEKSTIALALSFAIIKVSSKNTLYNILRIDEADAGFDEVRRQSYLETVLREMDNINCSNAYLITHNQMFENTICDVILLKDYDKVLSVNSLQNKNIIYSFDKTGI